MASGNKHSPGQRRRAKTAARVHAPTKPRPVVSTGSRLLTARHPYREARDSGWLARVEKVFAGERTEARRRHFAESGMDGEAFARFAEGHRSAWALARHHFWNPEDDDTVRAAKGIYLTTLWREYLPHRPSMEHIDDHLEAGSAALERGEREAALRHWIDFWDALTRAAPSAATSAELDGYLMSLRFRDWLDVFVEEAQALGAAHPLAPELARVRDQASAR